MFRRLEKNFDFTTLKSFFNFSLFSYSDSVGNQSQNDFVYTDNQAVNPEANQEFHYEEGRIPEVCGQSLYYPGTEGYQLCIKNMRQQYENFKNKTTVENYAVTYLSMSKEEYLNEKINCQNYYQQFLNSMEEKITQLQEENFVDQQINNVIRLIEKPCLLQVLYLLKIGYKTTASNAYNVGSKGVWFKSENINYFLSLAGEVWVNIALPTYINEKTKSDQKPTRLTVKEIKDMGIDPNVIENKLRVNLTLDKLTFNEVKEAIAFIENTIDPLYKSNQYDQRSTNTMI